MAKWSVVAFSWRSRAAGTIKEATANRRLQFACSRAKPSKTRPNQNTGDKALKLTNENNMMPNRLAPRFHE